jgi:hypothetical protein
LLAEEYGADAENAECLSTSGLAADPVTMRSTSAASPIAMRTRSRAAAASTQPEKILEERFDRRGKRVSCHRC